MEMNSELAEIRDKANALVAHLSTEDVAYRLSEIGRILADYDFDIDVEDIAIDNPTHILINHINSFAQMGKNDHAESEWFAALTLYLIANIEKRNSPETNLHFIRHAFNTSVISDERASVMDFRTKAASPK